MRIIAQLGATSCSAITDGFDGDAVCSGDVSESCNCEFTEVTNTTEEGPRRRFMVRPDDYRTAEKKASEVGADLLGFYHSHPDHPARPSQYDLDHAWPFFSYIIVSVREGQPELMTSWLLKDDRSAFDEEALTEN